MIWQGNPLPLPWYTHYQFSIKILLSDLDEGQGGHPFFSRHMLLTVRWSVLQCVPTVLRSVAVCCFSPGLRCKIYGVDLLHVRVRRAGGCLDLSRSRFPPPPLLLLLSFLTPPPPSQAPFLHIFHRCMKSLGHACEMSFNGSSSLHFVCEFRIGLITVHVYRLCSREVLLFVTTEFCKHNWWLFDVTLAWVIKWQFAATPFCHPCFVPRRKKTPPCLSVCLFVYS